MGDITKLEVWKNSLELAANVYKLTQKGNLSKDFAFRDQISRASISIPSNIAEGLESGFDKLGVRFFYIAKGSAAELRTQILLASKVNYLRDEDCQPLLKEFEVIAKMLNKLISYRKSLYKN